MKKIFASVLLFGVLLGGSSSALADSNTDTGDAGTMEATSEVSMTDASLNVVDDNNDLISTRAANSKTYTDWLNVGGKAQNGRWVPVSTKIWQVRYSGGIKYQGYMYWTGATKVNVSDPRPNLNQYQFRGTLNRA